MILEALEKNGSPLPEFETDENHDYFITRLFVRMGSMIMNRKQGKRMRVVLPPNYPGLLPKNLSYR